MTDLRDFENMKAIPTDELLRRARAINKRMCSGDRHWVMTVPVQDDDSDIVIGEVCKRLEAAEQATSILRMETCTCVSRPGPSDVPLDNVPGHHDFSCRFREVMQPVLAPLHGGRRDG